jgi:hypothetical protein
MEANPMKLIFRGVQYDYTPASVEAREDELAGKYRSAALKFRRNAAKVPVLQPALDLFYRGVSYKTGVGSQLGLDEAPVFSAPVDLFYRGVHYSAGPAQVDSAQVAEVAVVPQSELMTEQMRELVIQHRQKTAQREQSVLGRFEAAIG